MQYMFQGLFFGYFCNVYFLFNFFVYKIWIIEIGYSCYKSIFIFREYLIYIFYIFQIVLYYLGVISLDVCGVWIGIVWIDGFYYKVIVFCQIFCNCSIQSVIGVKYGNDFGYFKFKKNKKFNLLKYIFIYICLRKW